MPLAPQSTLCAAAPVFVVKDVIRSVDHYRDVLGFTVGFMYGNPVFYAGVERDSVLIHLQASGEAARSPGQGAVYVFVTDVDALHEELKSRGAGIVKAPKDYPYAMRDFNVKDIDGNHLCFGTESKPSASGGADGR